MRLDGIGRLALEIAPTFSPHRARTTVWIQLAVASVASRTENPGFLVEEMTGSRKWVHTMDSSVSIADTGVGARHHPCLWNRE